MKTMSLVTKGAGISEVKLLQKKHERSEKTATEERN